MSTKDVDNSADIIDSRDVIERIEEMESERDDLQTALDDAKEEHEAADNIEDNEATVSAMNEAADALKEWDDDNAEELKDLKALADEAEGYSSDWRHGATLIRDSYFKEYAEELADDIGAIDRNASWPCNCIDWDKAADELKADYAAVDFAGVTYWVR